MSQNKIPKVPNVEIECCPKITPFTVITFAHCWVRNHPKSRAAPKKRQNLSLLVGMRKNYIYLPLKCSMLELHSSTFIFTLNSAAARSEKQLSWVPLVLRELTPISCLLAKRSCRER